MLDVLQFAFQCVALAEAVSHGYLLRTGLVEGGVFRQGIAVFFADHAEVDAASQGDGHAARYADGVIPGAGDGGHRQGCGVVLIQGEFIHVRFFLSVALWRVRQAFTKFEFGSTWRSS